MKQPPLIVQNAAILKLYWSLNLQAAINVYGVHNVTNRAIDQPLADQLGTAIKTAYTNRLAALQPTSVTLARVGIRSINVANATEFRDTGAVVSGSAAAVDILPRAAAACVTLRTFATGKSFRGRSYIPGFSEAQNDVNGNTATAANTGAVNFVSDIKAALATANLALAVVSRPSFRVTFVETSFDASGNVLETHTRTHNARVGGVTDVTVLEARDARWQYQRRRDNGVGGTPPSSALALFDPIFRSE